MKGTFGLLAVRLGRNAIISGPDMNSSPHIDNKDTDIFIPGKGPIQKLHDTKIVFNLLYKA